MSRLEKEPKNLVAIIICSIILFLIVGTFFGIIVISNSTISEPTVKIYTEDVNMIARDFVLRGLGGAAIQPKVDPRESCVIITDGWGHGSGVYIGDGIILTAGHCIGIEGAWIIDNKGTSYAIIDQWADPYGEDVGFIKIRNKDIPALKFGVMPEVTQPVHVIGTPLDRAISFNETTGTVTRLHTDLDGWWYDAIIIDAATYPGNSGGPVLNMDNEIIGILVGGYVGYDNLNVVEPVVDILWSLKMFKER